MTYKYTLNKIENQLDKNINEVKKNKEVIIENSPVSYNKNLSYLTLYEDDNWDTRYTLHLVQPLDNFSENLIPFCKVIPIIELASGITSYYYTSNNVIHWKKTQQGLLLLYPFYFTIYDPTYNYLNCKLKINLFFFNSQNYYGSENI